MRKNELQEGKRRELQSVFYTNFLSCEVVFYFFQPFPEYQCE